MHYYKFNIGDYASHTRHLSPIEDIAYRRLLDLAYSTELPLTKDTRQLCRLINMREYQQEVQDVLSEFFFETEEGYINNRVVKEIEESGDRKKQAKDAAAKRWAEKRNAESVQSQCERNADSIKSDAECSKNDATHYPLPTTQDTLPTTQDTLPKTQTQEKTSRVNALTVLVGLGVNEQHAKDWLAVRKAKRAPLTQTAIEGMHREAEKAGITFAEAVEICARKNWQGFNASWDWKDSQQSTNADPRYMTPMQRKMAATDKAIEEWLAEDGGITVEGECRHA